MVFTGLTPLLSNKVLVLRKIESTYNVDAVPSPATDAILVSEVDVRIDPNVLERNNLSPSISPKQIAIGRKLVTVTMTHELKGSGTVGVAPAIAPLLRACGFAQTAIANSAAATVGLPFTRIGNSAAAAAATFARGAGISAKTGRYRLTVVKGGASATAKLRITGAPATPDETVMKSEVFSAGNIDGGNVTLTQGLTIAADNTSITYTVGGTFTVGDQVRATVGGVDFLYTVKTADTNVAGIATTLAALIDASPLFIASSSAGVVTVTFPTNNILTSTSEAVVVTSGTTALPIGDTNGTLIPTWIGSLNYGDAWDIQVLEAGIHFTPVSENFDSLTLYIYLDGLLHRVTGCMGTVVFSGEAGNFATAQFTFTGQYISVVDRTLPAVSADVYESSIPPQVENAQLALDNFDDFCAQSFSVDIQNSVTPRDCMNNTDGFNGVTITDRNPQGSVNPEMTLRARHDFWGKMAVATPQSFHVRVGTVPGNITKIVSDSVQYSNITYGDRNRVRTGEISLRFSQFSASGNDEIRIINI